MTSPPRARRIAARRAAARRALASAALALLAGGAGGCFVAAEPTPRLVIVVVLDALRSDHLSQYGYSLPTSPGLDRLTASATLFENAYAPASYTTASTASILTGQSPLRHRARLQAAVLRPELTTTTELLAQRGYLTRGISFNPVVSAACGFAQGFHDFMEREAGSPFNLYPDISVGLAQLERWLSAPGDEPAFLYFQAMNTHGPYRVPESARSALFGRPPVTGFHYYDELMTDILHGRLERRAEVGARYVQSAREQYDTAIRYSTDELGTFFAWLQERGRFDDALIVLTADHGDELFEHGGFSHGYSLQEEVLRVPLIVKLPGQKTAARVSTRVSVMDIHPTLTEAAGVTPGPALDGRSLFPLLRGRSPDATWERPLHLSALFPGRLDASGIISGHEKLIAIRESYEGVRRKLRLYDLESDPREEHNLARERLARARELVALLDRDIERFERVAGAGDAEPSPEVDVARLRALGYAE